MCFSSLCPYASDNRFHFNSQWENNVNKFYNKNPDLPPESYVPLAPKLKETSPPIPPQGSLYKRNEAVFFGEKPDDRASSRGSVFQQNAAHFYGYETPATGERPFEIPKAEVAAEGPKPVLAQRNVGEEFVAQKRKRMTKTFQ